jgi:hypothetical protein
VTEKRGPVSCEGVEAVLDPHARRVTGRAEDAVEVRPVGVDDVQLARLAGVPLERELRPRPATSSGCYRARLTPGMSAGGSPPLRRTGRHAAREPLEAETVFRTTPNTPRSSWRPASGRTGSAWQTKEG